MPETSSAVRMLTVSIAARPIFVSRIITIQYRYDIAQENRPKTMLNMVSRVYATLEVSKRNDARYIIGSTE